MNPLSSFFFHFSNVNPYVLVCCCGLAAVRHVSDTFIKTDEILLKPKGGFFGAMSERGVGGSKCGATCALALVLKVLHRTANTHHEPI